MDVVNGCLVGIISRTSIAEEYGSVSLYSEERPGSTHLSPNRLRQRKLRNSALPGHGPLMWIICVVTLREPIPPCYNAEMDLRVGERRVNNDVTDDNLVSKAIKLTCHTRNTHPCGVWMQGAIGIVEGLSIVP